MRKQVTGHGGIAILFVTILITAMITGCGSKSTMKESATMDTAAMDNIYMAGGSAEESAQADMGTDGTSDAVLSEETGEAQAEASDRKLIKNVDLSVETENLDALLEQVKQKVTELKGYMESCSVSNGSTYYSNSSRSANLTIRIPADQVDQFVTVMEDQSNVVSRNEQVEDVTLQYVDLASHKEALQTEQDRLLELMEQAETMEDIITIESRLSEVRYQIESMESQLRTFDNQVSYSTIYLYIDEVTQYTPVEKQGIWQRITSGFGDSLYGVGHGFVEFFIWIIVQLPYLIVWAIVILAIVLVIRTIRKARRNKRQNKPENPKAQENVQVSVNESEKTK